LYNCPPVMENYEAIIFEELVNITPEELLQSMLLEKILPSSAASRRLLALQMKRAPHDTTGLMRLLVSAGVRDGIAFELFLQDLAVSNPVGSPVAFVALCLTVSTDTRS
jgi:hypothetical protein